MKKNSRLLVVFGMVVYVALVQCNNPKNTETQEETQIDTSTSEISSETTKYVDSSEGTVIEEPKTTTATDNTKPPVIENSKTTIVKKEETPIIEKPKKIETIEKTEPPLVEEPIITTNPTITKVEKPTLAFADFFMKSVKATIKGTSTLHPWESDVTIIEGKGSFQIKDNMLASIKNAEIKIPVKGIKSEEGKKMDNKTYETFKSDTYPNITYTFNNADVKISESRTVSMETTGKLTMAGASKSVPISAHGKVLPNGDLQLTVSKKIKMTDFNMEPPVMFLGTIKVGDEITVNFDFVLSQNNN